MKRKSLLLPALALFGITLGFTLVSDARAQKPTGTAKPRRSVPNASGVMAAIKNMQRPVSQDSQKRLGRLQQAAKPEATLTSPNGQPSTFHSANQVAQMLDVPPSSIAINTYKLDASRPVRLMPDGARFFWMFYYPTRVGPFGSGNSLRNTKKPPANHYNDEKESFVYLGLGPLDPSKRYFVECDVTHDKTMYLSWYAGNLESSVTAKQSTQGKRDRQTISLTVSNTDSAALYLYPSDSTYGWSNVNVHGCAVRQINT